MDHSSHPLGRRRQVREDLQALPCSLHSAPLSEPGGDPESTGPVCLWAMRESRGPSPSSWATAELLPLAPGSPAHSRDCPAAQAPAQLRGQGPAVPGDKRSASYPPRKGELCPWGRSGGGSRGGPGWAVSIPPRVPGALEGEVGPAGKVRGAEQAPRPALTQPEALPLQASPVGRWAAHPPVARLHSGGSWRAAPAILSRAVS